MACKKKELFEAYKRIVDLNSACGDNIRHQCQSAGLTVRQIYYLRIIDSNRAMTFSQLADCTSNSKPTISEMINKFISQDCVYRERSTEDKRVFYIRLTEKGQRIARADELSWLMLAEKIERSLTEDEINLLIELFNKIK